MISTRECRLFTLACMRSLLGWAWIAAIVGVGCGGGAAPHGEHNPPGAESCQDDPLKTGIVAQQTGVSADVADCSILKWAAFYKEPDPMIIKAMIYGESRFDYAADGCTNLPCGIPDGWSEP